MSLVQLTPTDVGISLDFMRRKAPELARDIVCKLDHASNLAGSYGITDQQWMVLKTWPAFRLMVQEANEELGGSAGTPERARRKAALAISEIGVQDLATIAGDPRVTARDRINAISELKDIACLGAKQQIAAAAGGAVGSSFGGALIQIFLPNGNQLHVGEAAVAPRPIIEGEATLVEHDDGA